MQAFETPWCYSNSRKRTVALVALVRFSSIADLWFRRPQTEKSTCFYVPVSTGTVWNPNTKVTQAMENVSINLAGQACVPGMLYGTGTVDLYTLDENYGVGVSKHFSSRQPQQASKNRKEQLNQCSSGTANNPSSVK